MNRNGKSAAKAAAIVASSVLTASALAGCADSETSVDIADQAPYACLLVEDATAHDDVESWEIGIGSNAGPEFLEILAVPALLGVTTGSALPGHEALYGPAKSLYDGIIRLDRDLMGQSLEELLSECRQVPTNDLGIDGSPSGRVEYACALAIQADSYGKVADWDFESGDEPGEALRSMLTIPWLLGTPVNARADLPEEMRRAAQEFSTSPMDISSPITPALQNNLDKLLDQCADT